VLKLIIHLLITVSLISFSDQYIRINDFTGGIDTKTSQSKLKANKAVDITNMDFEVMGSLQKRKGTTINNEFPELDIAVVNTGNGKLRWVHINSIVGLGDPAYDSSDPAKNKQEAIAIVRNGFVGYYPVIDFKNILDEILEEEISYAYWYGSINDEISSTNESIVFYLLSQNITISSINWNTIDTSLIDTTVSANLKTSGLLQYYDFTDMFNKMITKNLSLATVLFNDIKDDFDAKYIYNNIYSLDKKLYVELSSELVNVDDIQNNVYMFDSKIQINDGINKEANVKQYTNIDDDSFLFGSDTDWLFSGYTNDFYNLGYNEPKEIAELTVLAVSGNLSGTYSYLVTYEYENEFESNPNGISSINLTITTYNFNNLIYFQENDGVYYFMQQEPDNSVFMFSMDSDNNIIKQSYLFNKNIIVKKGIIDGNYLYLLVEENDENKLFKISLIDLGIINTLSKDNIYSDGYIDLTSEVSGWGTSRTFTSRYNVTQVKMKDFAILNNEIYIMVSMILTEPNPNSECISVGNGHYICITWPNVLTRIEINNYSYNLSFNNIKTFFNYYNINPFFNLAITSTTANILMLCPEAVPNSVTMKIYEDTIGGTSKTVSGLYNVGIPGADFSLLGIDINNEPTFYSSSQQVSWTTPSATNIVNHYKIHPGTDDYIYGVKLNIPQRLNQQLTTETALTENYYIANSLVNINDQQIIVNIPTSNSSRVTARNIYRQRNNEGYYFLTRIPDNTTTTYNDNIPDVQLSTVPIAVDNNIPPDAIDSAYNVARQFYLTSTGRVYYSKIGKPESVPLLNYIDVNRNVNDKPVRIVEFFSGLVIFFKNSIWYIDLSQSNILTWFPRELNVDFGCKYPFSIIEGKLSNQQIGLFYFGSDNSVRVLNGVGKEQIQQFDNIYTDKLSLSIENELKNITDGENDIYSAYYDYKYYLSIPSIQTVYVWDSRLNAWTKFHYPAKFKYIGMVDDKLLAGNYSDHVLYQLEDSDSTTDFGNEISYNYKSKVFADDFEFIKDYSRIYIRGEQFEEGFVSYNLICNSDDFTRNNVVRTSITSNAIETTRVRRTPGSGGRDLQIEVSGTPNIRIDNISVQYKLNNE